MKYCSLNEEYNFIYKFKCYEDHSTILFISGKCIKCRFCWHKKMNIKPILFLCMNDFVKNERLSIIVNLKLLCQIQIHITYMHHLMLRGWLFVSVLFACVRMKVVSWVIFYLNLRPTPICWKFSFYNNIFDNTCCVSQKSMFCYYLKVTVVGNNNLIVGYSYLLKTLKIFLEDKNEKDWIHLF